MEYSVRYLLFLHRMGTYLRSKTLLPIKSVS